jgi:hypothetical protein
MLFSFKFPFEFSLAAQKHKMSATNTPCTIYTPKDSRVVHHTQAPHPSQEESIMQDG